MRDQTHGTGFSGATSCKNLQEFLVEKKLEQMRSPGSNQYKIPLSVLKNQRTKNHKPEYLNKNTNEMEAVDFEKQIHIISLPYTVRNQRVGGEYGKELIQAAKLDPVKVAQNADILDTADPNSERLPSS